MLCSLTSPYTNSGFLTHDIDFKKGHFMLQRKKKKIVFFSFPEG